MWFQGSGQAVKFQNRGIEILLPWADICCKKVSGRKTSISWRLRPRSISEGGNQIPQSRNPMKTAIIKTTSEKEKSLAQCSHSVIALILESSKGNPKSNSPSKSTRSEFLSNVVEVSKKNTCDKSPTIHSDKNRQKNLQMLLHQLKVPIVIILEKPVGTQIPKILRRFSC